MTCPEFDWRGFVLDEIPEAERRQMEAHLGHCAACTQEVDGLRLTLVALRAVPEREIPRRISFVSDPVFEPNWWQRFWNSGAKLAFASGAMLSVAIVVHAIVPRTTQPSAAAQAQMAQQVQLEVERRLPAAVDARVNERLAPAVNQLSTRLDEFEKTRLASVEKKVDGKADLREVKDAFDVIVKRMNVSYLSAARGGGD